VPSPSLSVLRGHPCPCSATLGTATTTLALLSMRGWDAATPAAVPRTDHRQRLPRARLRTPRPTTTPSPSKPPLFKYRGRHDAETGARTARTTISSTALYSIPPHVAKQCGMPVIHPLLGLYKEGDPLAAGGETPHTGSQEEETHTLPVSPTILALPSITPLGTWRPRLLSRLACSRPTTGTRCKAIQCLEHTPAGRTAPARTRINQVSLVA
jgi:hypothetical protein